MIEVQKKRQKGLDDGGVDAEGGMVTLLGENVTGNSAEGNGSGVDPGTTHAKKLDSINLNPELNEIELI